MPRFPFALAAVSAGVLLGACSTPSKPADSTPVASELPPSSIPASESRACDPAKAQWALGKPGDAALLEKARMAAGAKVARLLKPGQMVTMEYSAERLNVRVNDQGLVISVNCG